MRKVQISMEIQIFGDKANKNFEGYEPIKVYADSNDVYEALCSSFFEALVALQENGHHLPKLGDRSHIPTNEIKNRKARKLGMMNDFNILPSNANDSKENK